MDILAEVKAALEKGEIWESKVSTWLRHLVERCERTEGDRDRLLTSLCRIETELRDPDDPPLPSPADALPGIAEEVKTQRDTALAVLREVEWQKDTMPMAGVCPLCEGMPTPEGETPEPEDGHAPGCALAAALKGE